VEFCRFLGLGMLALTAFSILSFLNCRNSDFDDGTIIKLIKVKEIPKTEKKKLFSKNR
jgi:hypothetical protein